MDVLIRGINIYHDVSNKTLLHTATELEKIEPETLNWIDTFSPESIFYDIGASSGPFSLYAAIKCKAKVVAFEPDAQNYAVLEKNHFLNRKRITHPIISVNVALSNNSSLGQLYIYEYEAGISMKILDKPVRRLETKEFEPQHTQFVIKELLDNMISRYKLPLPNYIKIDVDGAELSLLEGSKNTLCNQNVKSVLIEIEENNKEKSKIEKIMKDLQFTLEEKHQVENYEGLYNCIFSR